MFIHFILQSYCVLIVVVLLYLDVIYADYFATVLCVFGVLGAICSKKFLITSFSLPFSVLSSWDWLLTWKTIILQCYYIVSWVI